MLGIVILLAVKQWNQKTKGPLYLFAFIIYTSLVGVDFNAGAYFISGNFIYFIQWVVLSLPIVIVLSNYLKNKTGWIRAFILLGTFLLIGGILYNILFLGSLPCPVGESRERVEQGFMIYYRDKTRAAWLFALGLILFQTGILGSIEKRIVKSDGN